MVKSKRTEYGAERGLWDGEARRFNSHRRAAQRLTLHCGTGVLGYHREAFTAGALESDCVGLGQAREMSLK